MCAVIDRPYSDNNGIRPMHALCFVPNSMRSRWAQTLVVAVLLIRSSSAQASQDRFVTVNGLRIHYLDWGAEGKQPLILLHGIGRIAHTFDHLAPHFSRNYHVIAVDMRGHGDSGWDPNGQYLVEDYVK